MKHMHYAGNISYRGKDDSVYISCEICDKEECIAIWHFKPPKGWSKKQWPKLRASICLYLDSLKEGVGIKSNIFEIYCPIKTSITFK